MELSNNLVYFLKAFLYLPMGIKVWIYLFAKFKRCCQILYYFLSFFPIHILTIFYFLPYNLSTVLLHSLYYSSKLSCTFQELFLTVNGFLRFELGWTVVWDPEAVGDGGQWVVFLGLGHKAHVQPFSFHFFFGCIIFYGYNIWGSIINNYKYKESWRRELLPQTMVLNDHWFIISSWKYKVVVY